MAGNTAVRQICSTLIDVSSSIDTIRATWLLTLAHALAFCSQVECDGPQQEALACRCQWHSLPIPLPPHFVLDMLSGYHGLHGSAGSPLACMVGVNARRTVIFRSVDRKLQASFILPSGICDVDVHRQSQFSPVAVIWRAGRLECQKRLFLIH